MAKIAEDGAAEWGDAARGQPGRGAAPVLSVEGFEGPLDWLLEMVRTRQVDLLRLSIAALIDEFAQALELALSQPGLGSAALGRWGDWLVMAADLALLRSRLLVPADVAEAQSAQEAAEALRALLVGRAEIATVVDWLEQRPQLGRDVFAPGRAGETGPVKVAGRSGDVTALLRACLAAIRLPPDASARYRVPGAPFWSVSNAIDRFRQVLPGLGEARAGLQDFLPPVPAESPDRDLRCRAALASTFLGGLELARDETLVLEQDAPFSAVAIGRVAA
ncbi:ScpA family protein [Acidisphaera sp. L21]|uniref:segregation and condensation protein A n=1 Tax=Acidisphaera sp. L21 TaxID=1641851 RepID=UPI00131D1E42|nr:segregation/condensation protein A [Acidisphaera sp. L21]